MKIKNILYKAAAFAAIVASVSCSDISEDDRLVYVKPAQVKRAVLIEDFTGQNCSNCPKATDEIKSLISQYGEGNIIAVGIHSGPLGFKGNSKYIGLRTDLGDEYYTYWGVTSQPNGMVNRTAQPSYFSNWGNIVRTEIEKTAPVSIAAQNSFNDDSRSLSIKIDVKGTDGDTDGKLQVWLVEDGITAIQRLPSGQVDYNYVHEHVFRDAVNGKWGEEIAVKEGDTVSKTYTYTLPSAWNADHVSVVAFVCDNNNRNVKQVIKKEIK